MIRLGIVGCKYGLTVHMPAFRIDTRCAVVALAGTDQTQTAELGRRFNIADTFDDWRIMLEQALLDAITIATPPQFQPAIAFKALALGKAVFVEKPMAIELSDAAKMLNSANGNPAMIDFSFTEISAWQKAKEMMDAGAIGRLRHVVVTWNVENQSTRERSRNWKTNSAAGGGVLGNFASHSLHYLEWPIVSLSANIAKLPSDHAMDVTATLSLEFASGASGSYAVSCASYLGFGHRLELYGEDGTMVLANATSDYMRGFTLNYARRPAAALSQVAIEDDPRDEISFDSRIAPVSRLANRFLDAIERHSPVSSGFAEGYRVQVLLDAARQSYATGKKISVSENSHIKA